MPAIRLNRCLRGEDGVALVVALGVMLVVTMAATAVIAYTSSNSRTASYDQSDHSGNSLAEAGVEYARAALWQLPAARWSTDTSLPARTVVVEGRTVTYSGTRSGNVWTLRGTVTLPNPSGGTALTRDVTAQVRVATTSTIDPRADAAWEYVFVNSSGCTTINDYANVGASMYIRGNLCMRDDAKFTGRRLHVQGSLNLSGNASIGDPAAPIDQVKVRGGCGGGCNTNPKINARDETGPPPDVIKPSLDEVYWYANAKPGPRQYCTGGGSFPGGFDNDSTLNASRSAVNLMPSTSYTCQVRDGAGTLLGELSWRPGSPGTLTVAGTILFDGPISINSGAYGVVSGRGTIYTTGTVRLNDNVRLCGVAACDGTWDPSRNMLALIAGGDGTSPDFNSIVLHDSAQFQGALFADRGYWGNDNTRVWGPIIADTFRSNDTGRTFEKPIGPRLPGMPSATTTTSTLENVAGSYRKG